MRLAALVLLTATLHAQAPANPFGVDLGYIFADTTLAYWSSPESVAAELRNPDPNKRLEALLLAGLTIDQAKVFATDQKTGKQYPDKQVAPIDAVQLTYAAIGTDDTVDAILTIASGQEDYAAIAIPTAKGWTRIASFACWCKYDEDPLLAGFVEFHRFPDGSLTVPHYELTIHASGGGTGIYTQNEARFRIRSGKLRLTLSFVSNLRNCPAAPMRPCRYEQRSVVPRPIERSPGIVLVTSRRTIPLNGSPQPEVDGLIRELGHKGSEKVSCVAYKWDEAAFSYKAVPGIPAICHPPSP